MTAPLSPLLNGFLRALLRWGAALVFCLPLRHKPHFWVRACAMLVPFVRLAWAVDPLEQAHTLEQQQLSLLLLYGSFFVLFGLMIHLCVEIDWNGALYCAVWSLLTAQTAYEGWCVLETINTQHGSPLNLQGGPARLVQIMVGMLFYGVVCGTLARKMPYKKEYHIGPRQLASAFFMGLVFMLQAASLSNQQVVRQWPTGMAATALVGQFYFLTILYLQTELFKKSAMQKEMDTLNLLYERQREQYQIARQNVQIINKRCHELKVQIADLRRLGAEAGLQQTLNEAETAARLYDASANTGNEVLDVVLTEKTLLCESRQVQLNAVADGSCLRQFEPGDLYALFANALDNAIANAIRVQEPARRCIDLLVCVRQGFVVINVISPERRPEEAETRAANYEVKVMKRIVQKYQGTLTTETRNGFFAIKIIFAHTEAKP